MTGHCGHHVQAGVVLVKDREVEHVIEDLGNHQLTVEDIPERPLIVILHHVKVQCHLLGGMACFVRDELR